MTRAQAQERKRELERRREALVDQLSAVDANSASISSGGGSKSFTNRSVADIKAKIKALDAEIARLGAALGVLTDPQAVKIIEVRFNRV